MSQKFPCPNPACPAVFAPGALKGVGKLTCPRCGTVFHFRAGPESAGASAPPVARPASRVPAGGPRPTPPPPVSSAVPVITLVPAQSGSVPLASPVAPHTAPPATAGVAALEFENWEGGSVVVRPAARRRRRRPPLGVVVAAGLGALAVAAYLYFGPPREGEEDARQANELNYSLPHPGRPWKEDDAARFKMQVNRVFRRTRPAGSFALLVRDYKTRLPGDAELTDEALSKLRNCFPKRLEWEPRSDESLGGQPARALAFEAADAGEVDVSGEVAMVGYRGFAYWLFFWGPASEKEALAPEWERVRGSFALGNRREGWKERPREAEPVGLPDVGVQLTFVKGLWEDDDPGNYDPRTVKAFKGTFPGDPLTGKPPDRHAGRVAIVQLLVLPHARDLKAAAARAKEYLLENQKDPARGNYPKTTLMTLKDRAGVAQDRDVTVQGLRVHVAKLQMANDDGRERFVTLAAVNQPGGVVVLWAECDWGVRDFWEQEFAAVVDSLQPLRGEAPARPGLDKGRGDRLDEPAGGEKGPGREPATEPAPPRPGPRGAP